MAGLEGFSGDVAGVPGPLCPTAARTASLLRDTFSQLNPSLWGDFKFCALIHSLLFSWFNAQNYFPHFQIPMDHVAVALRTDTSMRHGAQKTELLPPLPPTPLLTRA